MGSAPHFLFPGRNYKTKFDIYIYCPLPPKTNRTTNKHDPQIPHNATQASNTSPAIFKIFVLSDSTGWLVIRWPPNGLTAEFAESFSLSLSALCVLV